MIKAHKIRLHPTPEQSVYFAKAAGTTRFVWNWGLAEWNRQHEAGEKPTALTLKKQFNAIKREQFPWVMDVTKNAADQPFLDLGKAFTAFFKGWKSQRAFNMLSGNKHASRYPKFKSRKKSKGSFYLANDQFEMGDHRVRIPKLGWVNLAETLRFPGKLLSARITKTADWWFLSVQVEVPNEVQEKKPVAVGVDAGLSRLATLSTGEKVENQVFLKKDLKKLRKANKCLHRRKKGSQNRKKAQRKVARAHYRIACKREDMLQKLTTHLAECYGIIGIEDLHVKGMLRNRCLSRAFSDAALGTLLDLLCVKVEQRGGQVVKVGRFFPSTKTCHCCGWKWEDMELSDRVFVCKNSPCAYFEFAQDRDHNAALNILQEALRLIGRQNRRDQAVVGIGLDET